jgi:hypothetical protein
MILFNQENSSRIKALLKEDHRMKSENEKKMII